MANTTKNPDFINMTSPKGTAKYPWVENPNTKFNADGVYSIDLILPLDEAEEFMSTLDELNEKFFKKAAEGLKPVQVKKMVKSSPYRMEEDDEGNETGNVIFSFKEDAVITNKKKGTTRSGKPKLFDAFGKEIKDEIKLGSGSTVRVAFLARPKGENPLNSYGVKMLLRAVQVIDLVEWGGGSASSFGFGVEDSGTFESKHSSETSTASEGEDDSDF